jgi:ABC-type Fe3+/spermidine/putrescine transport system ATPase subunit
VHFLEVKNLFKSFDVKSRTTLKHISFAIKKNEVVSMIGPSGTGKSTTAKIIKGFVEPDEGEVFLDGELMIAKDYKNQELIDRISYVPQELSLNNDKTIFENIAEPLGNRSIDEIHKKVRDMIEVFGLEYKDHKFPYEISTGQKQRVEMAKALVTSPSLVILDEPFSNLDQKLRNDLKDELIEIMKDKEITVLSVTHDLDDALSDSDRVLLLGDGVIKQYSTPKKLYAEPQSAYVAKFTGPINLIASQVLSRKDDRYHLKNTMGEFIVHSDREDIIDKDFLYLAFRPEGIISSEKGRNQGKIIRKRYFGSYLELWIQSKDKNKLITKVGTHFNGEVQQKIRFDWEEKELYLLPV